MPDAEHKTNAMRVLDAHGIPYTAHYFSDEIHSAEGVAEPNTIVAPAWRPLMSATLRAW